MTPAEIEGKVIGLVAAKRAVEFGALTRMVRATYPRVSAFDVTDAVLTLAELGRLAYDGRLDEDTVVRLP